MGGAAGTARAPYEHALVQADGLAAHVVGAAQKNDAVPVARPVYRLLDGPHAERLAAALRGCAPARCVCGSRLSRNHLPRRAAAVLVEQIRLNVLFRAVL